MDEKADRNLHPAYRYVSQAACKNTRERYLTQHRREKHYKSSL